MLSNAYGPEAAEFFPDKLINSPKGSRSRNPSPRAVPAVNQIWYDLQELKGVDKGKMKKIMRDQKQVAKN